MSVRPSAAFGRAMIAALPAVRRYATGLCGNASLADDLVQDGIERALLRANQLQSLDKMAAWLRTIVYNLYIDDMRRRRTRGTGVDVDDLANDLAFSTPARDGAEMRDLVRATAQLSVEHRQVLVLVGVEELSYREIAEELSVPIGTVMSRLARARSALRDLLGGAPAHAAAKFA